MSVDRTPVGYSGRPELVRRTDVTATPSGSRSLVGTSCALVLTGARLTQIATVATVAGANVIRRRKLVFNLICGS